MFSPRIRAWLRTAWLGLQAILWLAWWTWAGFVLKSYVLEPLIAACAR
jgi:hypothetical protein